MAGAGDLRERVDFEARSESSDGAGGATTGFSSQFTRWAGYTHLRGGEAVIAARLQGKHVQVIRVRRDSDTLKATTDWRIRDRRTGEQFAIRDISPTIDRAYLDFLCESGVAA